MVEQSPRSIPDQEPQHLRSLGRLRYEIDRAFESSLFLQAPGETTVTPNGGAITSVDPGSGTTASSITGKTEVRNRSCFRIKSFSAGARRDNGNSEWWSNHLGRSRIRNHSIFDHWED